MSQAGPVGRAGSVCRDLGSSVKRNKNQVPDYMTTRPARLVGIPANRAENFPCNRVHRASPAEQASIKFLFRAQYPTKKSTFLLLNRM